MIGIENLGNLEHSMFQEKCYLRFFQLICDVTDDVIQILRQIVKSGE